MINNNKKVVNDRLINTNSDELKQIISETIRINKIIGTKK